MATVRVFNPSSTPVVYGRGKTIGGNEWQSVKAADVQQFIDNGSLIVTSAPAEAPAVVEPEAPADEPVAEDAVIDDTSNDDEPATISTSRRRKPQPEKE